jgi:esterase/lipase superfamily enzyme
MALPRHIATAIAVGFALACGACTSTRPPESLVTPLAEAAEGEGQVQILAATNRRRATSGAEMFTGERAVETSYASVTVAVPPATASSSAQFESLTALVGTQPRNYRTLGADHLDKRAFSAAISNAAKGGRSRVLVFVHGFNNRFDDAVYRFAQVVHDSRAEGIPVLFTWPSRGELRLNAYAYDRESAIYSRDALEQLLDTLASNKDVKEVNILAHSMGNWVTLEALRGKAIGGGKKGIGHKIKNVFLVAPDVDVDVFRTQIQRMGSARPRFALFVAQDDKALSVSQWIWGGMPRIGDINPEQEPYRDVLAQEQVTVFDLTKLDSGPAHTRAFDDITKVVVMVREQLNEEPVVTQGGRVGGARGNEPVVTQGGRVSGKRANNPAASRTVLTAAE